MSRHWGFDRGFDSYEDVGGKGLKRIVLDASKWLKTNREEKFFLFLHTYDVHSKGSFPDYRSPEPFRGLFSGAMESKLHFESSRQFRDRWKDESEDLTQADKDYVRATYAEGIRYVDDRLRTLFDLMKALEIYDSALVIVWSDHGEGLFSHELWGHGELYDHTIRVPLIMRIPGIEKGKRIRSIVTSVDLAPTILALIDDSWAPSMDGQSVLDLLYEEDLTRLGRSLKTKNGKRRFSVRSLEHHIYVDQNTGERFFFDLEKDPKELENLYPARTAEAGLLERKLADWIEHYDQAWSAKSGGHAIGPDSETMDQLRALGYLAGSGPAAASEGPSSQTNDE